MAEADIGAIVSPEAAPAPVAAVAEPAVTAPVSAPVAETVAPAEPAPSPTDPAPAAVETPAEPAPTEPAAPPTEAAPEATPEAAAEAAPEESPAPIYADFKLPEGLQAPAERIGEFTSVLGKYNLTQEAGQELMDLHGATLKQMQDHMAQQQQDAFADTRKNWREAFFKQAGAKADTLANDAKWAIAQLVPNADARKELHAVLGPITGVGDNPHIINLLAAAAKKMRERAAPSQGLAPRAPQLTPAERRYGPRPAR